MSAKIAVFGASGFIGRGLVTKLRAEGFRVIAVYRDLTNANDPYCCTLDLQSSEQIAQFLNEAKITHLINAVGKAHDTSRVNNLDYDLYRTSNVVVTENIANAAINSLGVQKLILLSTSKVYGQLAYTDHPSEGFKGTGLTIYGLTKLEGERALLRRLKESKIEPIIIRMPLVYGKGVKGNLHNLRRVINLGLPVPLKGITENRRSMLSMTNLCSFINLIINTKKLDDQVFNLKDANDYSTAEIIHHIISANKMKDWTFTMNYKLLEFLITRYSKSMTNKLLYNETINDDLARTKLSWAPQALTHDDMHF